MLKKEEPARLSAVTAADFLLNIGASLKRQNCYAALAVSGHTS